jgi:hypothetical protein
MWHATQVCPAVLVAGLCFTAAWHEAHAFEVLPECASWQVKQESLPALF